MGKNPKAVIAFSMAYGGGLSIFGDFLFKEYDSYGKTFWNHLAPPVASDITPLYGAINKTLKGKNPEKEITRLIRGYTPCQNLFYTEKAFKELIQELE